MIVADTDVLSEPLRRRPSTSVLDWLAVNHHQIAITTITVGELLYGVERLPHGDRKARLIVGVEQLVAGAGERLLPYDEAAARRYALIRAARDRSGRPVSVEDQMIAAICLARDAAIATRNVGDFDGFGVEVINPWGTP